MLKQLGQGSTGEQSGIEELTQRLAEGQWLLKVRIECQQIDVLTDLAIDSDKPVWQMVEEDDQAKADDSQK